MIVKMKFLSITGPKSDFDRITNTYLSKYEIQLENALSELKTVDNLTPFAQMNPYKDALSKAEEFLSFLEDPEKEINPVKQHLSEEQIFHLIRNCNHDYMEIKMKENNLKSKQEELQEKLSMIQPFKPLQFDLHRVLQYKYVKFRFGRVLLDYYHKLEKYIYDDLNVIFLEGARDSHYVYGVYFVSKPESEKTDAIFKALHFERLFLPDEYDGTPMQASIKLEKAIDEVERDINHITEEVKEILQKKASLILRAKMQLEELSANFDLRKVAACVEDKEENFYILCGWMTEEDVEHFLEDIKGDNNIFVAVDDDKNKYFGEPPTKLSNPKVFKPFELFVKMYGLPSHNEMDPTIFVAITYTFIFGVMFGDVGQGACLFIGGAILYKLKHIDLAGIISVAGIFSMIFGWMFGSVFGFENIIKAKWLRPMDNMTTLPFVGRLNTVFVVAIVFGMVMILFSMILQIINAWKAEDTQKALFDANGIAGFLFYASAVVTIFLFMTGHNGPAGIVLFIMFGLPLLMILFQKPLANKIMHKVYTSNEGLTMFFVEGFFELFETILSYFSNTLSFVRLGAFAVSHGAMMQVVLMLAGAESGNINWIVVILGNIFVCGMEGLIVGIQVLRLEYYEMFSRFYSGTGREFKPYLKKTSTK
ncbi:MAG: V-type ATPase 116kDa subunit family protein [Anaerostipes sp.]|nr:V-type ATPase 116kDa subunit family protein [Anaerostipes sp.]